MSEPDARTADVPTPEARDAVPELEYDETIAPRPEEEVADVARATPDPQGHGG
jgi:hypothetical protein